MHHGTRLLAIEVKSGLAKSRLSGLAAFQRKFPEAKSLLVGHDGIPIEEFLQYPASSYI